LYLNDLIRISALQVFRQRRRYWGVALAITLGTAGLITIFTMGQDVKRNINQDLDLIGGATVIRCFFDNQLASTPQWFRPTTLEALRDLPGVAYVTSIVFSYARVYRIDQWLDFSVVGVDEYFWKVRGLWPVSGRLFGPQEIKEREKVCLLGEILAKRLFGSEDAVGNILALDKDLYKVIGVLGGLNDPDLAAKAYFPITTVQDRFLKRVLVDRIYVRCQTWDDVPPVAAAIPGVVAGHQPSEQLKIEVAWTVLKHVRQVAWWVEFFVYLSLSATLLLGGVGICNIMMAAVRSRTREIGLKKAFGAEDLDILAQFLMESLWLSLGAAFVGGILGRIIIGIIGWVIGHPVSEDLFFFYFGLSFVFAILLGVSAGLYPSLQASRMEVAAATRYE
jgi:putative ABC transport system permease protein